MNSKYLPHLDILRLLAIFGVITIHVCVPLLINTPVASPDWWIGLIYTTIFRPSVPLFFMISGLLILSSPNTQYPTSFLKKRLLNILLPFLIWNFIYAFLTASMNQTNYFTVLKQSLSGSIFYHLWFMYLLISLYLIAPILRTYLNTATKSQIQYFLILWFIITCINPVLKLYTGISLSVFLSNLYGYLGYFMLGYYLHTFPPTPKQIKWLITTGLLSVIASITLTFQASHTATITETFYLEYLSLPIVLYSISIYLIFANLTIPTKILNILPKLHINQTIFHIYLIHPVILYCLNHSLNLSAKIIHPVIGIPSVSLLILSTSFILTFIIKKTLLYISTKITPTRN